jgi:hypothetical protein
MSPTENCSSSYEIKGHTAMMQVPTFQSAIAVLTFVKNTLPSDSVRINTNRDLLHSIQRLSMTALSVETVARDGNCLFQRLR